MNGYEQNNKIFNAIDGCIDSGFSISAEHER